MNLNTEFLKIWIIAFRSTGMACPREHRLRTPCHACPLQNGPWCVWLWFINYIKILSDLMQKLNLSNIIENLHFGILTVMKLWPCNNYMNLSKLLGANALCRDELLLGPPNIHILSIQATIALRAIVARLWLDMIIAESDAETQLTTPDAWPTTALQL